MTIEVSAGGTLSPQDLARCVDVFPALSALPPRERDALRTRGMVRSLPAGTIYLREGQSCTGIALVLEGRIRVARTSPGGREITLYHIGSGETCILSASCLLSGETYPAQATVVADVTALVVPADLFRILMATVEPVRDFVMGHFAERLAAVMALVEEVAFARVDRRAASWLVTEASGVRGHVIELSHEEIASHLGTARVVVSRVLENFEERGWVGLGRRRVEVRDPSALAAFGNQSD